MSVTRAGPGRAGPGGEGPPPTWCIGDQELVCVRAKPSEHQTAGQPGIHHQFMCFDTLLCNYWSISVWWEYCFIALYQLGQCINVIGLSELFCGTVLEVSKSSGFWLSQDAFSHHLLNLSNLFLTFHWIKKIQKFTDVTFAMKCKASSPDNLFETRLIKSTAVFCFFVFPFKNGNKPVGSTFVRVSYQNTAFEKHWMEMKRRHRAGRSVDTGCDLHSHGSSVYFDK